MKASRPLLGAALLLNLCVVSVFSITCNDVPRPEKSKRCYICNAKEPIAKNDPCINKPDSVTPGAPCVACTKKYCTTFRQQEKKSGTVVKFFRTCEDDINTNLTLTVDKEKYTFFYPKCTKDRCNSDDGTSEVIDVGEENFFDDELNIVVPGLQPKSQAQPTVAGRDGGGQNVVAWAMALGAILFTMTFNRVPTVLDQTR